MQDQANEERGEERRGTAEGQAAAHARATEREALAVRFNHLRRELVETVYAYDRLTKHDLAQLRLDYMVQAGCWGSRELIAQHEADRCFRRYAIAEESLSRSGSVDSAEVERQVAHEFAGWDKRRAFIVSVYDRFAHEAIASDTMEDEERAELSSLYRAVIGRVHPALGAADDEVRAGILERARAAFEGYDLKAMREAEEQSRAWARGRGDTGTARLRAATVIVEAQLEIERAKLESARASFPRTLEQRMADPSWLSAWRAHFGGLIAQHERRGARYQEAYGRLCGR